MLRLFFSEFIKIRTSSIWLLVPVSPLLSAAVGYVSGETQGISPWIVSLNMMVLIHALLFLPLLTGVFAAFVCRYEHAGGGWKQLLALPVKRSNLYLVKLACVMMLLFVTQLLFLAALLVAGWMKGMTEPVPWGVVLISIFGGWLACMPLAALQMAVSAAWSSFAAPLALNVIFTLPNILVVNSAEYGPYYPWAQPLLAMIPRAADNFGALNGSLATLFIVIMGSLTLFLAGGLLYFQRKAV